jgi:Pyruvate/2-oxoacid:ferredoxin oxidoreductase gamma subunit
MEREVILTGIGGQGVQLAAKILAEAANREGREVMMFGVFMGMIRGGSSESTVVISTAEIIAPPIVPRTWAVLGLHPEGLGALRGKIRPQGVLVLDANLATKPPEWPDVHRLMVPATDIAKRIGQPMGTAMVILGAFATVTGLVATTSLAEAMRHLLPPHRRHLAEGNERCLAAGAEFFGAAGHADVHDARLGAWS